MFRRLPITEGCELFHPFNIILMKRFVGIESNFVLCSKCFGEISLLNSA